MVAMVKLSETSMAPGAHGHCFCSVLQLHNCFESLAHTTSEVPVDEPGTDNHGTNKSKAFRTKQTLE